VEAAHRPREDGADLLGAQRDDGVHTVNRDLVDGFRTVPGDVDPDFGHRTDSERVDGARLGSGAVDARFGRDQAPGQAFGHLAARGVGDAQEEDAVGAHAGERTRSRTGSASGPACDRPIVT
jgi:hypothetical protein